MECCAAAYRKKQEETLYRAYVTDALKAISENTTQIFIPGHGLEKAGANMTARWVELAKPAKEKPEPEPEEDTRTAREIADDIWAHMKGGGSP